jgi:hypothetical protein
MSYVTYTRHNDLMQKDWEELQKSYKYPWGDRGFIECGDTY